MNILQTVLIPSAIFVVLDGAYWFFTKKYLNRVLGKSDSIYDSGSMKTAGFVVHILIELFALIYFLILGFSSILNAFIFGIVLQGYTSSINYAIIKDWNLTHTAICTLWKGILFALTVYISRMF